MVFLESHKCKQCSEGFDTQHLLRNHVSKIHPTFRYCSKCDYKHKLSSQLKRHEEQAHGASSVACSVDDCEALMPYRQLKSHFLQKHPELIKDIDKKVENNNFSAQLATHKLFEESGTNPRNIFVIFFTFKIKINSIRN